MQDATCDNAKCRDEILLLNDFVKENIKFLYNYNLIRIDPTLLKDLPDDPHEIQAGEFFYEAFAVI